MMTQITLLQAFLARADARALLWQVGQCSLHDAVDALQMAAEQSGLVAAMGQDAVQAIISEAFDAVSVWAPDDEPPPPMPTPAPRQGAAASTLDAAAWLWFQVGDVDQFRSFLNRHAKAEIVDIFRHIEHIKAKRHARNQR
jgi:hypothetical protein